MKNIVALDTSTEACSVALQCGDNAIYRYKVEPRIHAKALLPMLNECLAEAGIKPRQLDGIAFSRGPGAFTGVRIATAAAQAIALGADIPVAPVSTLAAIAVRCYRETGNEKSAVAIDARMGEVYWGAYVAAGNIPQLQGSERVCSPNLVDKLDNSWCAAGTGWQTYGQELSASSAAIVQVGVDPFPHALDVLSIGKALLERGDGVTAENALPVYLRDNVAQTEAQRGLR